MARIGSARTFGTALVLALGSAGCSNPQPPTMTGAIVTNPSVFETVDAAVEGAAGTMAMPPLGAAGSLAAGESPGGDVGGSGGGAGYPGGTGNGGGGNGGGGGTAGNIGAAGTHAMPVAGQGGTGGTAANGGGGTGGVAGSDDPPGDDD
jgi:hypothetical protein